MSSDNHVITDGFFNKIPSNRSSISLFLDFWLKNNPLSAPERDFFEKYYSSYRKTFSPYIQHHYASQTVEVNAAIRELSHPDVLEVGTGCGTEALWFNLLGAKVTAIDLSDDRLSVARARKAWLADACNVPVNVEFYNISLFEFLPSDKFDIIWMEQTFHHLEPRSEVYATLYSLLRPGGRLFISESNAWNIFMQLQLFFRRGFKTKVVTKGPNGKLVQYGNERITTPFFLARGLRKSGFVVKSIRSFRILPNIDVPIQWLGFEKFLLKLFPFLSTHFNMVAQRPDNS